MICTSFHIPACHLYILFGKVSVQVFCPVLSQAVYFLIVKLCVLCIIVLRQLCLLLTLFSQSDFSSHSLNIISGVAEVFNFNEFLLINSFFNGLCLGIISKKSSPSPGSYRFSLLF